MKSVAVKVSASGRVNLPSEVRKALGLKGPGQVVITMEDDEVRLKTMAQALEHVRALGRVNTIQGRRFGVGIVG